MGERLLFLTGRLAEARLTRILEGLKDTPFTWTVHALGVKVAALMTQEIITRRLPAPVAADRVIVPGRCRADLDRLSAHFGVPFVRGPEEVTDLPAFLGRGGQSPDLSRHSVRIFAEIVEASEVSVAAIVARAKVHVAAGADVIDLGCLPDTPFPHLEDAVAALKGEGIAVSVDSADPQELIRGGRAGADYLFSLSAQTLWVADEVASTPVLIPHPHGDPGSLLRAMDALDAKGRAYLADPILDPVHFGFMASLERYAALRRARPGADILMGTGNLTELTDADTTGIVAMLMGICSELSIGNVLVVQVSPHNSRTVQEHDIARRIMHAAKADGALPKGYAGGLMGLRVRRPFATTAADVAVAAAAVRDPNYRIEVTAEGVHLYNRDGHSLAADPFTHFPSIRVEGDTGHAFYLGAELARAEIAFRLGKRYAQDRPLDWGVAVDTEDENLTAFKAAGTTKKDG